MTDLIERTALSEFTQDGKPVRVGQVVTIDRLQLGRLVKAGCVAESDEENAAVPKADLPATQWGSGFDFQKEIDEAATEAADKIAAHRKSVDDARETAEREIAGHQTRTTEAAEAADKAIAAHGERARKVGEEADEAIAEHKRRLEAATQESGAGSGAETNDTPPASGKPGKPKG
ncbi:hypothetical protein [Aureimonas sp. SK2]|uniref:hypothetical protein n=1 Tax=Aureimonas sp. SK2 TaxID=3015992 RepID=UPI002444CAA4|nr:hypothetical protein [Aureimonas sp. SK2]